MTREEALAERYVSRSELINKIYNDHEAQIKAKDEEIEILKAQSEDLIEQVNSYEQTMEDDACGY